MMDEWEKERLDVLTELAVLMEKNGIDFSSSILWSGGCGRGCHPDSPVPSLSMNFDYGHEIIEQKGADKWKCVEIGASDIFDTIEALYGPDAKALAVEKALPDDDRRE